MASGDEPRPAWLVDTLQCVQRSITRTDETGDLLAVVTAALVAVDPHRVSWAGRADAETSTIAVRAAAGDCDPPAEVDLDPDAMDTAPSKRATESDEVLYSDASETPEYDALRGDSSFEGESAVTVPISVDGEPDGVVTVYTTADVGGEVDRDVWPDLGAAIADSLQSLATARRLQQEQRRVEMVRSTVSHDLGNPLHIAGARLELVEKECESSHLDYVADGLEQIDTLADEALEFVKVSRAVDERERFSLETIVREGWELVSAPDATLEVTDTHLHADPERFRRLLDELFRNAVGHSDDPVTVSVAPLTEREGFYVADDGPGIPEDKRDMVFDWGYTTTDGDGHGLTVVREIADAHDWTVTLADPESGTRIEVVTERW